MAQDQVYCGFSEVLLQIDEGLTVRVYNRDNVKIELNVHGEKLSITKKQWFLLKYMTENFNIAFTLLEGNCVLTDAPAEPQVPQQQEVQQPRQKRKRAKHDIDAAFQDIMNTLGIQDAQ